jgi:hypothetical protein
VEDMCYGTCGEEGTWLKCRSPERNYTSKLFKDFERFVAIWPRSLGVQVRGVRRALRAMRGGLVIGAGGALHGVRIVCDAMRCDARDAIHGMRCNALRCAGRCAARADALRTGCDAMRCARAGCIRAVQAAPCF